MINKLFFQKTFLYRKNRRRLSIVLKWCELWIFPAATMARFWSSLKLEFSSFSDFENCRIRLFRLILIQLPKLKIFFEKLPYFYKITWKKRESLHFISSFFKSFSTKFLECENESWSANSWFIKTTIGKR